jgi:gamma-glutamyltranspeptidase/glutathione hydrolase
MVGEARDPSKWRFETHKKDVVASGGVVVANHPLASSAGATMLAHGGNAFDAAVASLFALTVAEPMMVSVFGAGFFVIRNGKSGLIETLDNYAVAPKAATEDMYDPVPKRLLGQNIFETVGRKNQVGHLSVATPGTLKAWERIVESYGNLRFSEVVAPAINLARDGYRASPYLSHCVGESKADLERFSSSAEVFIPRGRSLRPGDRVVMPDYAETLETIARVGSGALYGGELGGAVVDDMAENDGLITMRDLVDYRLIERPPVSGSYRDRYDVFAMAPGSSGGTHIIQMLNMLENRDVASMGFSSVEHVHLFAEVLKIAFADRQRYMGDPEGVDVPVSGLTSKKYAAQRVREIEATAQTFASGDPTIYENDSGCTTHVSAMDSEGNMVAATQTLNNAFGSKVVVPSTGMMLNNCMALFDPRPGRANSVAGGKRMLSSMSPTIVLRDGEPFLCIGTPGGLRIFPSVCQAIVNIVDFGMPIQQAVEAPRIWTMGIPGTPGEKLHLEPGFGGNVMEGLESRGHEIVMMPRIAGGMNGVLLDRDSGLMHGAACWRADGAPVGVSGGYAHPRAMDPQPPV